MKNIPEGYKETELGIIPKEWEVKKLGEVADESIEHSFIDGDWIESEYLTEAGIRLLQTGNIGLGKFIDKENKKYISSESFISLNCKEVKNNDILICRLADPTGRSCIISNSKEKMITSVDCVIFRVNKRIINNIFINYFLNSEYNLKRCKLDEQGSTRKRITRKKLEKYTIPVPPLPEQEKIAEILSSVDERIDLFTTQKEEFVKIKKGLMEKLLIGKIRVNELYRFENQKL